MQATNSFKDIEVNALTTFIKECCQKSGFFEGAILTGSLVRKTKISCVNDIDLIISTRSENQIRAKNFLEALKALLLNHLDYCLLEIDSIDSFSNKDPKFGLIWTSRYLKKDLFGTIDLTTMQATHNDFIRFQDLKMSKTQYFKLNDDFKMTDIFPIVHGCFSLNLAKKFLAVYAYKMSNEKPVFFDKEGLLQKFPTSTPIEKSIIEEFNFFYTNGELVDITPLTQTRLGKLAYLIQDLYLGFRHE